MRYIIVALLFALCATASFSQESTSFSFATEEAENDSAIPAWLTATGETLTINGEEYPVYANNKCGYAVHLRGKYFVYMADLEGTGETTDAGQTVYQTCKGTPYIFVQGSNGIYAKYGRRKIDQ